MRDKLAEIKTYLTGSNRHIGLLYLLSAVFIGLNCYFVYREIYWLMFLPAFLVILYFYFYSLDKILFLITLFTPLAINITQFEFNVGVSVPTEPLMFGVLILFILRLFFFGDLDARIWRHPMTIIIGIQLLWMLITSLTSSLPLVSLKHFLARLWFVVPFYLIAIRLFSKISNIQLFSWLYILPLLIVIGYTTYHHYLWGFNEEQGHWVMEPFYNDHTVYGAILALFIPVFTGITMDTSLKRTVRFFAVVVLVILVIALFLSFSRAAWLSLAFVFGIFLLVIFKIRFRWILLFSVAAGLFFYFFSFEILDRLEKNQQGPSANFVEHLRSVSNISTDNSNLERINRWQSAIRMFQERPVTGFGPGTYQFQYAPFQRANEKTLISTNAGDKGNAHSEYIGPLAEQGLPGMILMLVLVAGFIVLAIRVYNKSDDRKVRLLSLSMMLALLTYFIHGIMNNFLDTDKASVPVWGFIAAIVALDIYHVKKESPESPGKEIS